MRSIRYLIAAPMLALSLLFLSSCAVPSETPPAETTPATDDLRAHYDALVVALQAELSDLRADAYITAETLRARVDALEAALESLGVEIPSVPLPDTIPTDSPETSLPMPAETTPPAADTPADWLYIIEDGSAVLTGGPTAAPTGGESLVIPAELDGYPVTKIGDNALRGSTARSIILPATVTHIGWFAFADCPRLQAITIPASVRHMDYGVFDGCPALTIYCPRDTYAARYAAAFALPFVEI